MSKRYTAILHYHREIHEGELIRGFVGNSEFEAIQAATTWFEEEQGLFLIDIEVKDEKALLYRIVD